MLKYKKELFNCGHVGRVCAERPGMGPEIVTLAMRFVRDRVSLQREQLDLLRESLHTQGSLVSTRFPCLVIGKKS